MAAPLAVARLADGVNDSAEPGRVGADHRLAVADHGAAAEPHPFERAEGHHQGASTAESHDFAAHRRTRAARNDLAAVADRQACRGATHLDQHSQDGGDPTVVWVPISVPATGPSR